MARPSAIVPLGAPIRSALAVLALAALGAVAFVGLRPDLKLVEHVVFEGQVRASPAELRHLADLPNGTSIWGCDPDRVATSVERHPWVARAEASFEWPGTLRVRVEEHRPVALLHDGGRLVYLGADGTPFLPARTAELDLPHLTGVDADLGRLHPELPRLAVRDALWLIDTLDVRGLVSRDRVSEVAFSRTSGLTVHAGAARIVFGHDDQPRQLDRLASLVQQGLSLDDPTFVDLAPATVAIVRPLAPAGTPGG